MTDFDNPMQLIFFRPKGNNEISHPLYLYASTKWPEEVLRKGMYGQIDISFKYSLHPFFSIIEKVWINTNSYIR